MNSPVKVTKGFQYRRKDLFMSKKLLDIVRDKIRFKQYSLQTERSYLQWIKRYILFHQKRHPKDMGKLEIEQFLTHLATENVASSTQNQAFNAILFLYNQVLDMPMYDQNIQALRAKQRERIPVVLSREEVMLIISYIRNPTHKLAVSLLYGCGLRLKEVLSLRILHLDFAYQQIRIMDSKSLKDRVLPMPKSLIGALEEQVTHAKRTHEADLLAGYGAVYLPNTLSKKYPNAEKELKWQYLFPAGKISKDPR